MLGILGKKIGMTTFFSEAGEAVPVTVIEAGPYIKKSMLPRQDS